MFCLMNGRRQEEGGPAAPPGRTTLFNGHSTALQVHIITLHESNVGFWIQYTAGKTKAPSSSM